MYNALQMTLLSGLTLSLLGCVNVITVCSSLVSSLLYLLIMHNKQYIVQRRYTEGKVNSTFLILGKFCSLLSASCPKFGSASSNESYVIDRVSVTCYRVVTSPKLTWLASRDACTNNNERLTVLEPVEKARFIQFFLNTNTGEGRWLQDC